MKKMTASWALIHFLYSKRTNFVILVFLMIILGLTPCIDSLLLKTLVDTAEMLATSNTSDFRSTMFIWIFIYAGWWESCNILWRTYDYCYLNFMPQVKTSIVSYLFEHTQKHSYKFFQDHLAGYITTRIMETARSSEMVFSLVNESMIRRSAGIMGTLYIMYYIHHIFAMIFALWLIFFFAMSIVFSGKINCYAKLYSKNKARVSGRIVDSISNIGAVKMFANSRFESRYLKYSLDTAIKTDQDMQWFMFKIRYVQSISASLLIGTMLYYLIDLKYQNQITIGDFIAVIGLCTALADDVWDLVQDVGDVFEEFGAFSQGIALLQKHAILDAPNATDLVVTNGTIEFKNVVFRHNKETNFFSNKSVVINGKQKVGLVGFSGSGKTTFVSLINRLYELHAGEILIDGTDIATVAQESLHRNISFIPQEPILFHRSIRENIVYGPIEVSDEVMFDAAKKAHIHDAIMQLPEQYDTLCGERGNTLSGGQRQRIIIARAVIKNAPILILDEATSALDTITENLIQKSLEGLMKNKTTIVIAHRLSTLLHMDRILVFSDGRIVEDGTHDELLKSSQVYRELWHSQVHGFIHD